MIGGMVCLSRRRYPNRVTFDAGLMLLGGIKRNRTVEHDQGPDQLYDDYADAMPLTADMAGDDAGRVKQAGVLVR